MPDAKLLRAMWRKIFWARGLSKKCTTITTSPGARNMRAKSSGSCAKVRRPRFPDKKVLSAEAWAMMRLLLKASIRQLRGKRSFQRFMAPDESCRGRRRKENSRRSETNDFVRTDL